MPKERYSIDDWDESGSWDGERPGRSRSRSRKDMGSYDWSMDATPGETIRHLRQRKGWTQIELAQALATAQTCVSALERNRRYLSPKMAARLAEIFGVPASAFGFRRTVPEESPRRQAKAGKGDGGTASGKRTSSDRTSAGKTSAGRTSPARTSPGGMRPAPASPAASGSAAPSAQAASAQEARSQAPGKAVHRRPAADEAWIALLREQGLPMMGGFPEDDPALPGGDGDPAPCGDAGDEDEGLVLVIGDDFESEPLRVEQSEAPEARLGRDGGKKAGTGKAAGKSSGKKGASDRAASGSRAKKARGRA